MSLPPWHKSECNSNLDAATIAQANIPHSQFSRFESHPAAGGGGGNVISNEPSLLSQRNKNERQQIYYSGDSQHPQSGLGHPSGMGHQPSQRYRELDDRGHKAYQEGATMYPPSHFSSGPPIAGSGGVGHYMGFPSSSTGNKTHDRSIVEGGNKQEQQ